MTEQLRFNLGDAESYMNGVFDIEVRRQFLTERLKGMREKAKREGVPTQAVDLAIKAARNHDKAMSLVTQQEFDRLVDMARDKVEMHDDAKRLGEEGPSAIDR